MSEERANLNLDKLGIPRLKPAPWLFDVRLSDYQPAAEWVRAFAGQDVEAVVLDAYVGRWLFYDIEGEFLFALPHSVMERINHAVCLRSSKKVHAREASRDSQALGGAYPEWGALTREDDGA